MKILVIQKKRIGDVLTSTILLEGLKEKFPNSELHYLVYENSLAVIQNNPFLYKIVVLSEKARKQTFGFIKFLFSIRKERYDVVVDAYGKPNSVIIGWFSGAKKTITFDKPYSKLFYSDVIHRNELSQHGASTAIEHRMNLLKPLNIDFKLIKPKIFLTEQEIFNAKATLIEKKINLAIPLVMISVVGSSPIKTFPLQNMAIVVQNICKDRDIQVLFNYFPHQQELAKQVYEICDSKTQKKIFLDIYENDLRKFLGITTHCNALIGNEGGATNMAKALNIPTFTIFATGVVKNSWNIFENETTNVSVHVHDYVSPTVVSYTELINLFVPSLFQDKLNSFLNFNCTKK